jgi:hypothetical protein
MSASGDSGFSTRYAAYRVKGEGVRAAVRQLARAPYETLGAYRATGQSEVIETIANLDGDDELIGLFDDPEALRALTALCCACRNWMDEIWAFRSDPPCDA